MVSIKLEYAKEGTDGYVGLSWDAIDDVKENNITKQIDPNGSDTTCTYDTMGRKTSELNAIGILM